MEALLRESSDPLVTECLEKYLARLTVRKKGLRTALFSKPFCTRHIIIASVRRVAPVLGFILVTSLHFLLMGITLGL